jgi:hypothetical protein
MLTLCLFLKYWWRGGEEGSLRGAEAPLFYKQIPLPITKGKGIKGIGFQTLKSKL